MSVSVALVIQHAMRMRRIILLSVTLVALQYFPRYIINGMIFGKTLLTMQCILIFSTTSVCKVSQYKKK
jgi:hypothetical protein